MSAGLAIQQAVYTLLKNDAALNSKITGIFDGFPERQPFPYITIGDTNSNPFLTFEKMGEEIYMTIHIWSQYKGYKEGQQIAADVQRLLAQKNIITNGYGTVASFFDSSDTMREDDGITRHLMFRYRYQIQH